MRNSIGFLVLVSAMSWACSDGSPSRGKENLNPKEEAATREKIDQFRDQKKGQGSTMTSSASKPSTSSAQSENREITRRVEDNKTPPASGPVLRFDHIAKSQPSAATVASPAGFTFNSEAERLAYLYSITYNANAGSLWAVEYRSGSPSFETLEQRFGDLKKIEGKYQVAQKTNQTQGADPVLLDRADVEIRGEVMTVDVRLPGCEGNLNYRIVRADGALLSLRWESTQALIESGRACAQIAPLGIVGDQSIAYVLTDKALYLKSGDSYVPLVKR
jgi:hypothetical protein